MYFQNEYPEIQETFTFDSDFEDDSIIDNILDDISQVDCHQWTQCLLDITQTELDIILGPDENETEEFESYSNRNYVISSFNEHSILDQAIEEELGALVISNHYNSDNISDLTPELHPPSQNTYIRPQEPYMEMIAKAILSSADEKILLLNIYNCIKQKYPNITQTNRSWKNSVRHDLSTNPCFVKAGRAPNGRGFFWTIHPGCLPCFKIGNFQRRDALRGVQRYKLCVQSRQSLNHQNRTEQYHMNTQPLMLTNDINNKIYSTNNQQQQTIINRQTRTQQYEEYTKMQIVSNENIPPMFCF